ncbi:MAG: AAA family ATPase [Dysgonamonadaceae bacterium]|jgi:predicted AAA+ superfamily ATPase|nr:AAA family ATPase [Dysgonamonadaceae bacterium]
MESFYRTHEYLLQHLNLPLRRRLMDAIDGNKRLICVRGSRGVGKTNFLLQYAKENFAPDDRRCLYINLNNFYFTVETIQNFAQEFRMRGGKVLLIDQIFKYPNWASELAYCYEHYHDLKIIFSASSVINIEDAKYNLQGKVTTYTIRGFSFREFLELQTGRSFKSYLLDDLLKHHVEIAKEITAKVQPLNYLDDYFHHGFYPFYLEKHNFSENLLKTMNMMLEIDVLSIHQIEQSYLPKLRKLLYLLSLSTAENPNITQLSIDIETSRATVMNYLKYLEDARLINLLYHESEEFPKKPDKLYLHNPNLLYATRMVHVERQSLLETFFYNQVHKDYKVNQGAKNSQFLINSQYHFNVGARIKGRFNPDVYYAIDGIEIGEGNVIPLWLFGFLY